MARRPKGAAPEDEPERGRRPKGTGSIRNRGTERAPRYFARYYVPAADGRRQVQGGPWSRKKDAEAWLQAQLEQLRAGRPVVPERITVAELLDDWLEVSRLRLSPNTWEDYERHVRLRLRPKLGHHRLSDLRPAHIAVMLNDLRHPAANLHTSKVKRPLTGTSLQHVYATLRIAMNWAVRQRLIAHNPVLDVDRPRRSDTEMKVWTADELARFLECRAGDRLLPLWRLASFTGARRSELLGLQWADVDLDAPSISVRRVRVRTREGMLTKLRTKSERGVRVVDLDSETAVVMRRWRAAQRAERLAWGPAYQVSPWVFTLEDGEALPANRISKRWPLIVASEDVPVIRFHDLRHTHASLLLAAGVPPIDVAARIGDSLTTLLATYAHVIPRRGHLAAEAFAALVGQ